MKPTDPKSLGVLMDTRLPVDRMSVRFLKPYDIQPDPHPQRRDLWITDTGLWSTKIDPLVDDWRTIFRGQQESE